MSKKRSLQIYSLADFQKADRLDRIRMHMIEPERFDLGDDDQKYFQALQEAWLLVCNETREVVAIRLIQEQVPGFDSWYRSNKLLRDVETLFAPFLERNKAVQRARVVEKLYLMASIAERQAMVKDEDTGEIYGDKEWMEIAGKLLMDAAKLDGLDRDTTELINPDDVTIPEIEITSDPQAFFDAQASDEADYDEFDEWPEEGLEDEEET